jgi:hypothetical protein
VGVQNYHPFGEVIGPDGLLYVTNQSGLSCATTNNGPFCFPGSGGQVLIFNPKTGNFVKIYASSDTCGCDFNGPTALTFGPDGRLYVTSFAKSGGLNGPLGQTTDKILIFAGPRSEHPGRYLDHIDLDHLGSNGVVDDFAAPGGIVFGPQGILFVAIFNGGAAVSNGGIASLNGAGPTGEVRRYDVQTKTHTPFVPSYLNGGPMTNPNFMTFGNTDSATLAYDDGLQ